MNKEKSFNEGYEYYVNHIGGYIGSEMLDSYLKDLYEAICSFKKAMNSYKNNNNPNLHGILSEEWHTHTFNIDAVAKRTGEYVARLDSNKLGSVDVVTSWGENYGLKYYQPGKHGDGSALAQAKSVEECYRKFIRGKENPLTREEYLKVNGLDPETDMSLSLYVGQARLIPFDQLPDAITALEKKIAHDAAIPERQYLVARYQETLNKLKDHIESPNGAKSLKLSYDDSIALSSSSKEGSFDPKRFDITVAKKAEIFHVVNNALFAGLTATFTSAILKAIPTLITAVKNLINDGYIAKEDIENIGDEVRSGAKDGFINGFFCASITSMSQLGYLGEQLQSASFNPKNFNPILATVVVLTKEAIRNSMKLAKGKITVQEFCYNMEKTTFIAVCGLGSGIALQSFINIPLISYTIGQMVGSIVGGWIYEAKEKLFLSLCVNNGYVFWGLVEQDYEMPLEVQKKLGYDTFDYESLDYSEFECDKFEYHSFQYDSFIYDKLDIVMLKRGVIGVRKIGYVN